MRTPALHLRALAAMALAFAAGACGGADVEAADQEPALADPSPAPIVPEGMEEWAHLLGHNTPYESRTDWNGRRAEGFVTLWHANGGKHAEGSYDADGRRTGPWVFWFENGKKRWEGTYAVDAITGLERAWYDDGTPHYQATYDDGLLEGECSFWHPNGRLMWKGQFARGKRHGTYLEWSVEGALDPQTSGVYAHGQKTGEYVPPAAGPSAERPGSRSAP